GALQLDLVQRRVELQSAQRLHLKGAVTVDRVPDSRTPEQAHQATAGDVAPLADAQRIVAVVAGGAGKDEAPADDQVATGVESGEDARQVARVLVAVGA